MALALLNLGFVSINRTQRLLSGLTPNILAISQGYLSKLQKRFSQKLSFFVEEVHSACISSDCISSDLIYLG